MACTGPCGHSEVSNVPVTEPFLRKPTDTLVALWQSYYISGQYAAVLGKTAFDVVCTGHLVLMHQLSSSLVILSEIPGCHGKYRRSLMHQGSCK